MAAFALPIAAAVGSKLLSKKMGGASGGGSVGLEPRVVNPGPPPQPPLGASAHSLGEARSQDKMRMHRQYGM